MRRTKVVLILVILSAAFIAFGQDVRLPMQKDSVKFAVIGDNGTGESAEYQIADKLVASHDKFPFGFVLMMGDNLYGGESAKDFTQKFEKPFMGLLDRGVKFYAALGN